MGSGPTAQAVDNRSTLRDDHPMATPEQLDAARRVLSEPAEPEDAKESALRLLVSAPPPDLCDVVLAATLDRPYVAAVAFDVVNAGKLDAVAEKILSRVTTWVDELADEASRSAAPHPRDRRYQALLGCLGEPGLLRACAVRWPRMSEAHFARWWREHPEVEIQSAAASALVGMSVENALLVLREGIPGARPEPSGTGELDHALVRHLLANASFKALRSLSPERAFDELHSFVLDHRAPDWFRAKRANILWGLLVQQARVPLVGSSWMALAELDLHRGHARPDPRWLPVLAARLADYPASMIDYAEGLRRALTEGRWSSPGEP